MGQRKTLNEKRLTKKQVQEIISKEGKLHQDYTAFFKETRTTGYVKEDVIYELPNDRFLFVFDYKDSSLGGKGDIYSRDYFLKWMKWKERLREDSLHKRTSSVGHWMFYSKNGASLMNKIDLLIIELSSVLQIDIQNLDRSYKSLDIVSERAENYGLDKLITEIYDNLVVYIGEVLRLRVNGHWKINTEQPGKDYPFIDVGAKWYRYMPINVVWSQLSDLETINFRKEVGNEVRRMSGKIEFQKATIPLSDQNINGNTE